MVRQLRCEQQKVAKVLKTIIIELAIWNPEWNMWLTDSNAPARSTSCLVDCMFSASDAAVGSPCCAETESGWFCWFWLPPTWALCIVLGSLLSTVCAAEEKNGGKSSQNKLQNRFYLQNWSTVKPFPLKPSLLKESLIKLMYWEIVVKESGITCERWKC
jgi:hypothetical protein